MTSFNPEYIAQYGHPFKGWDDLRPTAQCRHCHGTGMADEYNECGFCDEQPSCRNCDKPIDRGDYCSRTCEGMDRHPAPREEDRRG